MVEACVALGALEWLRTTMSLQTKLSHGGRHIFTGRAEDAASVAPQLHYPHMPEANAHAADPQSQTNNEKALQGSKGALRLCVGGLRMTMLDGVLEEKPRGGA